MNTEAPGPLRLLRHVFTHIECKALPEREKGGTIKTVTTRHVAQHKEDERRFKVDLHVTFGPEEDGLPGYEGHIQVIGFFEIAAGYPVGKISELVKTEGSSLLFMAVGELVCNLTARGPWPMIRLGNVNYAFLDSIKASKKATSKTPKAPQRFTTKRPAKKSK